MTREPEEQLQCHPLYSVPVPGPPHKTKCSPSPFYDVRSSHWGFRLPNFRQVPLQSPCRERGNTAGMAGQRGGWAAGWLGSGVAGQPGAHPLQTCLIWKLPYRAGSFSPIPCSGGFTQLRAAQQRESASIRVGGSSRALSPPARNQSLWMIPDSERTEISPQRGHLMSTSA